MNDECIGCGGVIDAVLLVLLILCLENTLLLFNFFDAFLRFADWRIWFALITWARNMTAISSSEKI
jgi:hypothetical protein